jgi:hypothetical protein
MKELLYYPGFEVKDENWLKFALLYIRSLDSIVPVRGDSYLSNLYREINNTTDFFYSIRPDFEEGINASIDALEQLEKLLRNPSRYQRTFGMYNLRDKWMNKSYQDYTLFREKYTYEFEHFCLENNIAHHCEEGVKVPRELAFMYMGQLSSVISDKRGLEAITDYFELDRFNILTRRTSYNTRRKITLARNTINLYLPKNIQEISFKDILELRNSTNYYSTLDAFHHHLDKYLDSLGKNTDGSSFEFIDSLNYSYKNLICELTKLTPETGSFIVGVWTLLSSPNNEYLSYIGNALTFGAIGATTVQISNEWKNSKTNRFAKKYLANLEQLSSDNQQVAASIVP